MFVIIQLIWPHINNINLNLEHSTTKAGLKSISNVDIDKKYDPTLLYIAHIYSCTSHSCRYTYKTVHDNLNLDLIWGHTDSLFNTFYIVELFFILVGGAFCLSILYDEYSCFGIEDSINHIIIQEMTHNLACFVVQHLRNINNRELLAFIIFRKNYLW